MFAHVNTHIFTLQYRLNNKIRMDKIKYFIKEFFKNDIGKYDRDAEKTTLGCVLYWVFGSILVLLITLTMIFVEGYLNLILLWNPFNPEKPIDNAFGSMYLISSVFSGWAFLRVGSLTTYRINGNKDRLSAKKMWRWVWLTYFIIEIIFYILALLNLYF